MGRASNRKKAARQGHRSAPQADHDHGARALEIARRAQVLLGMEKMEQESTERQEQDAAASLEWCDGIDPEPADRPDWPVGSVADRFFTGWAIERARVAPSLRTADIPPGVVITDDPAHWSVATNSLIRAIVFDGLTPDDPPVRRLLGILAPVAADELAYAEVMKGWNFSGALNRAEPPEFPELDGPVFLLGASALVDAFEAVLGDDALHPVLLVLRAALDGAVPGLDSGVLADALIGGFATHYRCEQPGDGEVLARIGESSGDPLQDLVASGAVTRASVLPVGLHMLAALTALCQSDAVSLTAS